MTAWILFLAIFAVVAVLSHRRSRLEQRVLKHIPLIDWLTVLIFPFLMFIGWVGMVKNIMNRPFVNILPFDDFDLLLVATLFLCYSFVGNGMHFTGKVIWRYLSRTDHSSMIWKVNEMFHNKLGHYIVYVTLCVVLFLTALLEINHPLTIPLEPLSFVLIVLAGIVFGFSGAKSIYYTSSWFGGYHRPLFVLILAMVFCQYSILKLYNLRLSDYPIFIFVYSIGWAFAANYILRQVYLFSHLSGKNRLRFLHKIFSA